MLLPRPFGKDLANIGGGFILPRLGDVTVG
jgi:hypothetical protein